MTRVRNNACTLKAGLECGTSDERQIDSNARRLLKSLVVNDPKEAPDGPGDHELQEALVLYGDVNEDPVIEATRRIGRLAEIFGANGAASDLDRQAAIPDAIEAAQEFILRSTKALRCLEQNGDTYENDGEVVTVNEIRKGNSGDVPVNDWIAEMMCLYEEITGQAARTSVNKPGQRDEGIASGPFIRFLKEASKPIGLKLSEDALRGRVPTIKKVPRHQV